MLKLLQAKNTTNKDCSKSCSLRFLCSQEFQQVIRLPSCAQNGQGVGRVTIGLHRPMLRSILETKLCGFVETAGLCSRAKGHKLACLAQRSQITEDAVPDSDCRPLSSQSSCSDILDTASQAACCPSWAHLQEATRSSMLSSSHCAWQELDL